MQNSKFNNISANAENKNKIKINMKKIKLHVKKIYKFRWIKYPKPNFKVSNQMTLL